MLMPVPKVEENSSLDRPAKVGDHYEVIRKIGEGSFGIIYLGRSDLCREPVAIKFESRKSVAPQLRDEYRAYKTLNSAYSGPYRDGEDLELRNGIPRVYFFGQGQLFNYMILDYLGPSLEDLFEKCGRKFSIKTSCYLAIQMITRVQAVHKECYIYRDIKPDNFLLGRGDRKDDKSIYIVDFGMAKLYRDPRSKQHIPYREKKSLSGTARYMSINTHLGREQSRRDDMESLGNVFMYFIRGSLPWQGLKARDNREKYEKIGQRKQSIRVDDLCQGFPEEFAKYVSYTRRLGFEEEPDYEMCKNWFKKVYDSFDTNEELDWEKIVQPLDGTSARASLYESPQSTPNHLSGLGGGQVRTDRNIIAPVSGKHQPTSPAIVIHQPRSPHLSDDQPRRSFLRRLFCFCTPFQ